MLTEKQSVRIRHSGEGADQAVFAEEVETTEQILHRADLGQGAEMLGMVEMPRLGRQAMAQHQRMGTHSSFL